MVRITLETPIKRDDETITAVVVQKPLGGALRGLAITQIMMMDVSTIHKLLPRITLPSLMPDEVANLDPVDLMALGGAAMSFFLTRAEREMAGVEEPNG